MSARAKIEIYYDTGGRFRWAMISPAGQRIAGCAESFAYRWDAYHAAQKFKLQASSAEVVSDDDYASVSPTVVEAIEQLRNAVQACSSAFSVLAIAVAHQDDT